MHYEKWKTSEEIRENREEKMLKSAFKGGFLPFLFTFRYYLFSDISFYLPTQNEWNILSTTSSLTVSPTISPRADIASSISIKSVSALMPI